MSTWQLRATATLIIVLVVFGAWWWLTRPPAPPSFNYGFGEHR